MQKIFLLCGVPGSGKTWVATQLRDKFHYCENDDYIGNDYGAELIKESRNAPKAILATCPFAERDLRDRLERAGCEVIPVFVLEDGQTVRKRYEAREQRPIPSQHITRSISIKNRASEWGAFGGKSTEVLEFLRKVPDASTSD